MEIIYLRNYRKAKNRQLNIKSVYFFYNITFRKNNKYFIENKTLINNLFYFVVRFLLESIQLVSVD